METGYQRGKIQDESLLYEHRKHDGSYPIIGVNSFLNPDPAKEAEIRLQRSSEDEKQSQLRRLHDFHSRHQKLAEPALARLRRAVINHENIFAELMQAVRVCSLGQITEALYQVGGQYRRNM
jgi:methylmalonyl-CoA mutase